MTPLSPLSEQLSYAQWRPVPATERGDDKFHALMLTPGLSIGFLGAVLNRGSTAVYRYREEAKQARERSPDLQRLIDDMLSSITPADGLLMAQIRNRAQLPYWSKLAICDYRKRGYTNIELARAFSCCPRTITRITTREDFIFFSRPLPQNKLSPPGKFRNSQNL